MHFLGMWANHCMLPKNHGLGHGHNTEHSDTVILEKLAHDTAGPWQLFN